MTAKNWLLLITNLPGRNQTLRMRVWRAIKAAGAASLRDGVYLLPDTPSGQAVFNAQASDIRAGGGTAQVLRFESDADQTSAFAAQFDRTREFAALIQQLEQFRRGLHKLKEPAARRRLATLRRDGAAILAVDYFNGPARPQFELALEGAEHALTARFSPDEPRATTDRIRVCSPANYRGRLWATRERLWVDRICSAWLIRRFIDTRARFKWLKSPATLPRGAIGFDFIGAEFSHVGSRVTFEVLLASFGLEKDEALVRLGQLVHYLDIGGVPVPEAQGFASILSGARSSLGDDALTRSIFPVIDHLYADYDKARKQKS